VDTLLLRQFQAPFTSRKSTLVQSRSAFTHSDHALLAEAQAYLHLFCREHNCEDYFSKRYTEIRYDIEQAGTYQHTFAELEHGARVAWRNSARCIGRLQWQSLSVRDMRHLSRAEDIFAALVEHLCLATNGGKIRTMISVFAPQEPQRPGIRIWNPQLIRYAGYRQFDGTILGDPLHAEFTEIVRSWGWKMERKSPFDVLPIVIQMPGQQPALSGSTTPVFHRHYKDVLLKPNFFYQIPPWRGQAQRWTLSVASRS
jgi:nitric-oxide synthase